MDKISQVLGTATGMEMSDVTSNEITTLTDKCREMRKNLDQDYDFARGNLRRVLEQAMSLLPNAISLAREAESPRVYESTSAFIKTIAEINKDLLEITERNLKQNPNTNHQEQAGVTNNAIFVGTTEELFTKLVRANSVIENEESS